jgi:hypothetical protein
MQKVTADRLSSAERHRSALTLFAVASGLGALFSIALAIFVESSTPIFATVALVGLAVVSAHREAVFADETAVSGSMVVICASIVGLGEVSLLAPLLCAVGAAAHHAHLRDRRFLKLLVNLGATVVPALLAAGVFRLADQSSTATIVGAAGAVAIYWFTNNALVGVALGLAHGRLRSLVVELVRSDTVMLVFGLGGAMCGVVMSEVGVWTGVATLVALLVALDVFVISVPAGLTAIRAAWTIVLARGAAGGVAGALSAVVTRAWSMSALGAVVGLVSGVLAGIAVAVLVVGARLLLGRRRFDPAVVGGLVLVELPYPVIAAVTGVVVSLAGLSIGLVVASALVVAGSVAVAIRRRHAAREPQIDDDTLTAAVVEAMLDGLPSSTRDR